jgi:hypothetical protein
MKPLTIQKIRIKPFNNLQKNKLLIIYKKEYNKYKYNMDNIDEGDVKIKINSHSSTDTDRSEEKWDSDNTTYFTNMIRECKKKSISHGMKGRRLKNIHQISSIPLISLPIILSVLSKQLTQYELISSILLIIIGVGNIISAFLNIGQKYQVNLEYENRYDELASDIESELIKGKKYRVQFDVYLTRVRMKLNQLNKQAPLI